MKTKVRTRRGGGDIYYLGIETLMFEGDYAMDLDGQGWRLSIRC